MFQPLSEEQKQQWKEKIISQKKSGASIAAWCRQNEIADHVFRYWKKKLFPEPAATLASFTEISSEKRSCSPEVEDSGVCLECREVRIRLNKHFDSSVLKQCLFLLKEEAC